MYELKAQLEGGELAVRRAERLYAVMSLKNKRRYNYYLALEAGKLARQHVKAQRGLDGQPWAKRKRKPAKKLLTRIARQARLQVFSSPEVGTVTYKRTAAGARARLHQEGGSEVYDVDRAAQEATGQGADTASATEAQLATLAELGANMAQLQNLSWLRAGLIIKALRRRARVAAKRPGRRSWRIEYPERSFLGATAEERVQLGARVFRKILTDVETGRV